MMEDMNAVNEIKVEVPLIKADLITATYCWLSNWQATEANTEASILVCFLPWNNQSLTS